MVENSKNIHNSDRELLLFARGVTVGFEDKLILENVDLNVYQGEVLGFVGASGTGKTVLMRTILRLVPMRAGEISAFGINLATCTKNQHMWIGRQWGVLFQQGALFSSLTVKQNIQIPMKEHLKLSQKLMDELAILKIELVGLPLDAAEKLPAELSGGMIKRASLARALALDPALVFLDEPTSGLDPIGAAGFDELIVRLRETLGLTVFMVTHDLDSLHTSCDRIAVLGDKHVLIEGNLETILACNHPWVQSYFKGKRALKRTKREP